MSLYEEWLEKPLPEQLYHYTGKDSFLGIIQHKQFWASHILYQNDQTEFDIALGILEKTIDRIPNVLSKFQIDKNQLMDFVKAFRGTGIYTVSLTEERDVLSQWRGYANTAPGFCVGFKTSQLIDSLKISSNKIITNGNLGNSNAIQAVRTAFKFQVVKCIYDASTQQKFIEELVSESFKSVYNNASGLTQSQLSSAIVLRILQYAPIFKHDAFQEENEWRIIVTNVNDKMKEKERSGKSHFVPYFQLDFENQKCIGDVIIGPTPEADLVKNSTAQVCYRNDVEFIKSEERDLLLSRIPYRNW